MRTVKAEPLSLEAFTPFGGYAGMIHSATEKIGKPPIEFFRDMLQMDLGDSTLPSFSNCRVEKRPLVIDVTEYHSKTGEGILPLDGDALIHVGPATPLDDKIPLEKFRVFRVPAGTLVVLKRGIWHHAPFTQNSKPINVMVVLPERTYANDCVVFSLKKSDQIEIVS